MPDQTSLYLASTSPRRQALLRQIGVQFTTLHVDVNESVRQGELPQAYVARLSQDKALAGVESASAQGLSTLPVLAADTSVILDDRILGKPRNREHCINTLLSLSGRSHRVITAVTLSLGDEVLTELSETKVTFRELSEEDVECYWESGEPKDKAGCYGIQGYGAVFVEGIVGSYSNVVGLPIEKVVLLIRRFNVDYWQNFGN